MGAHKHIPTSTATSHTPKPGFTEQTPSRPITQQASTRRLTPWKVEQLQQTVGNRAVGQLLSHVVQRQMPEVKKETITGQAKLQSRSAETSPTEQTTSPGNTDLPDHLKSGLEHLSNMELSSVRVHYNSPRPAQLDALAYTEGQDIYVGHGQEKHLPHEGWHAVQQMQGRVPPTTQINGVPVNAHPGLEQEAEVMGAKALQVTRTEHAETRSHSASTQRKVAQLVLPAILAGMGAAEWIALGAAGYVVAGDAVNSSSGDITYTFDEMEGVLLPGGGNDVPAYRAAHPSTAITEATHHLAVWFGTSGTRKMGIKFGITFLYDGNALGNISLSIIDTYDWPGWAGNVNVNITPRSLAAGASSVRFTVNMGTNNSWFNPEKTGSQMFILRSDGDLTRTSTTGGWHHIG